MENVNSNIQQKVPPVAPPVAPPPQVSPTAQPVSSSPETVQPEPPRKEIREQKKRSKLPVILILVVILIAISVVAFIFLSNPGEVISPKPENIRVSNITSKSFTVTWITKDKTSGSVILLSSGNQLPGILGTFSGETFYDDRDVAVAQLEDPSFTGSPEQETRTTHSVTVYNLDAENSYSLAIGDKWFVWDPNEIELTEQVTTTEEPEELFTPDPAYGKILYQVDESPVSEAIVYAQVFGPYSIDLGVLSTTVNDDGGYYFDLANATFTAAGEEAPTSVIEIIVQTGVHTSDPIVFSKDMSTPFDTIFISNETELDSDSESSSKIINEAYATDNCCDDWGDCSSDEDWQRGWRACNNGGCPACSDGPSDSEEDESCDSNLEGEKANCAGDLYCYGGKCKPKRDGPDDPPPQDPVVPPGDDPDGYVCKSGWDPDCCENTGGECMDITDFKCSSGFVSNKCPGGSNNRCCFGTYSKRGSVEQETPPPEDSPGSTDSPDDSGDDGGGDGGGGVSGCHAENKANAEANNCANADGTPNWSDCSRKGMIDACADPNQEGVPDPVENEEGVGVQAGGNCKESWCSRVTSEHGCRDKPYAGYQGDPRYDAQCSGGQVFHKGIDVICPSGDRNCDITAVDDGTVIHSGEDPWCGGLGCCVAVRSQKGKIITAGHLKCDGDMPDEGERVERGDVIGNEGQSGRVTGLHTDVTVYDPAKKEYEDPTSYLYGGDGNEVQENIGDSSSNRNEIISKVSAQEGQDTPVEAYISENGYIIVTTAGIFIPSVVGYTTTTESLYIDESEVGEPIAVFYDINENGRHDAGEPKISQDGVSVSLSEDEHAIAYNLKSGFNIISFPFYSDDFDTASEILQEVQNDGGYATMLSRYNDDLVNRDGKWHGYELRNNDPYGDDFGLMPGVGYVIKSWEESTLIIRAQTFVDAVPAYFHPGWNLIAIHGSENAYTAESLIDATNEEAGDYSVDTVSAWLTLASKWESIIKDEEGGLYGFDFPIDPQSGYFVRTTGEGSFDVTY